MAPSFDGWKLPEDERDRLLARFPPAYPDMVADHVTRCFGVSPDQSPPRPSGAAVVGVADNGRSVQALVVVIDGTTRRPDGSTYHITWSLDRAKGAKPKDSNGVIREHGWQPVEPVPVRLEPKVFTA